MLKVCSRVQSGEKEGGALWWCMGRRAGGKLAGGQKWVEGLNNYGYSVLSSHAFTLGCFMEQRSASVIWLLLIGHKC